MAVVPVSDFTSTASGDEIKILFVGKTGCGKTTLIHNFLKISRKKDYSLHSQTTASTAYCKERNGVTVKVLDMACPTEPSEDVSDQLRGLTNCYIDLLVYCLPVGPGSKFSNGNPALIKSLQEAFGQDVWKQCILVCTFSDLAWYNVQRKTTKNAPEKSAINSYKEYLRECIAAFKAELGRLGAWDIVVGAYFDQGQPTITAVPAGDRNPSYLPAKYWMTAFLQGIEKTCEHKAANSFKQYRGDPYALAVTDTSICMLIGFVIGGFLYIFAVMDSSRREEEARVLPLCATAVGASIAISFHVINDYSH